MNRPTATARAERAGTGLPLVEVAVADVAAAGIEALRLFRILWPVWEVQATAEVRRPRPWGLIDRFVARAVLEGGLTGVDEIADFLGLGPELVVRCLRALRRTGHLEPGADDEPARFTPLGRRAVADGVRYEPGEAHPVVLVDAVSGRPLPARYQAAGVPRLAAGSQPPGAGPDGDYHPVFAVGTLDPGAAQRAVLSEGREGLDLPAGIEGDLRIDRVRLTALPAYLVHTAADDLVVCTAAARGPDEVLSPVARALPGLRAAVASWVAEREPAAVGERQGERPAGDGGAAGAREPAWYRPERRP